MSIERCWLCGGEADTSIDDDGYVFVGCDENANCPNNIFNSDNAFETETEAIEWWNEEARKVYKQCPKKVEQTNEEWLRSLNTEQLADWLTDTFDLCGAGCSNCFVSKKCLRDDCNEMPTELIVEWLKEKHTDA